MTNPAVAVLESALRARKLDYTLTDALRPLERADPSALAPMDVPSIDACLHGGLPRGQLSELSGPCSSGRTTLLLQLMAAATQRGEIAAYVDTFDRLDVASAAAAGVDLDRLLWIRGRSVIGDHKPRLSTIAQGVPSKVEGRSHGDTEKDFGFMSPSLRVSVVRDFAIDRALKAFNLVLQAGGFGIVALDLTEAPLRELRQIPFTTWPRVQRAIAGSDTACVLLTEEPLARSAGGLTLSLAGRSTWAGDSIRSRRLLGADVSVRVVSPRKRIDGNVVITTRCSH